MTVRDPPRWPRDTPLSSKVGTIFRQQVAVAQSVDFACGLKATEFVLFIWEFFISFEFRSVCQRYFMWEFMRSFEYQHVGYFMRKFLLVISLTLAIPLAAEVSFQEECLNRRKPVLISAHCKDSLNSALRPVPVRLLNAMLRPCHSSGDGPSPSHCGVPGSNPPPQSFQAETDCTRHADEKRHLFCIFILKTQNTASCGRLFPVVGAYTFRSVSLT
jgi:hypothetical protein